MSLTLQHSFSSKKSLVLCKLFHSLPKTPSSNTLYFSSASIIELFFFAKFPLTINFSFNSRISKPMLFLRHTFSDAQTAVVEFVTSLITATKFKNNLSVMFDQRPLLQSIDGPSKARNTKI